MTQSSLGAAVEELGIRPRGGGGAAAVTIIVPVLVKVQ
jgi:hypothetical protein